LAAEPPLNVGRASRLPSFKDNVEMRPNRSFVNYLYLPKSRPGLRCLLVNQNRCQSAHSALKSQHSAWSMTGVGGLKNAEKAL
jgi:hypothetical protein